jgi:Arc/MetJ-type ribon-helix-helix transcriptional regulator
MAARRAVTVRIPEPRLRRLMRARKFKSQSDLVNALLAEEEERIRSHRAIRETAGTARPSEIHDRLL